MFFAVSVDAFEKFCDLRKFAQHWQIFCQFTRAALLFLEVRS